MSYIFENNEKKHLDFLVEFPARRIRLARALFEEAPNFNRRGVQIRRRRKLGIQ